MHRLLFVIAIGAAACGGKASSTSTTTAAPASVLEVGEMTILDHGQPMLKIHADGSTEMGGHSGSMTLTPGQTASTDSLPIKWEAGPKIGTDGTISKDGEGVRVTADGKVIDSKTNQAIPITLGTDKVDVTDQHKTFTIQIAADGTLTIPQAGAAAADLPHVQGADTVGKRRTVLVLVALTLMSAGPDAPPPTQSAPVETSTPASTPSTH